MTKPDFLIIGAMKAGTTSLWDLLRQHPEVCMSSVKETRFFSHDKHYASGWDWYESLFQTNSATRAIGEVTPHYAMAKVFPRAAERIARHLADVRIIYCIRDPMTIIPSFWKQLRAHGGSMPNRHLMSSRFDDAVRRFAPLIENARYWSNLDVFRQFIPDKHIHIMFFEDFATDPGSALDKCCQFLGVSQPFSWAHPGRVRNSSNGKFMYPNWIGKWRGTRLWGLGNSVLPKSGVATIRKFVCRPLPTSVEWSEDLLDIIRGSVGVEAERILKYGGKDPGFWSEFRETL